MELDILLGKEIITKDAYRLGTVQDLRCETVGWSIIGLRIKLGPTVSPELGPAKTVLLAPESFRMNDVLLSKETIESVRSRITQDDRNIRSLTGMEGMKVYTSDALLIGSVDVIDVDIHKWRAVSFTVRLDKGIYPKLDLKKGFVAKKASGLDFADISGISDAVVLNINSGEALPRLTVI